jgi:hypothetical protein
VGGEGAFGAACGSSQRTMFAKGLDGSGFLRLSVQKQASLQVHRPLLPSRMMCSQESSGRELPAVRMGRIDSGGTTGGLLSGRGGGVSKTLSHTGMCLQAPSPLQSHSQSHAAHAAVQDCAASATTAVAVANFMPGKCDPRARMVQCAGLAPCYRLSLPQGAGAGVARRIFIEDGEIPGVAFITEDTEDTENTEGAERRAVLPMKVALSSVTSVFSVSSVSNPPSPYAGFGAGWGTASRMGMFTTAASAARAMSAYHIQS